jgi:hypothetical protein
MTITYANERDLTKNKMRQTKRLKLKVQTQNLHTALPKKLLLAYPDCWRRNGTMFMKLLICRFPDLYEEIMQPNGLRYPRWGGGRRTPSDWKNAEA